MLPVNFNLRSSIINMGPQLLIRTYNMLLSKYFSSHRVASILRNIFSCILKSLMLDIDVKK